MKKAAKTDGYSINKLALLSGFDRRTLVKILQGKKAPYSITDFCAGVRAYFAGRVVDQRERRARIQADRAELSLETERKALMPASLATRIIQEIIILCRTELCHLPDKLAYVDAVHALSQEQARQIIDTRIRECLTKLADCPPWFDEDTEPPAHIVAFNEYISQFPPPAGCVHHALVVGNQKQKVETYGSKDNDDRLAGICKGSGEAECTEGIGENDGEDCGAGI